MGAAAICGALVGALGVYWWNPGGSASTTPASYLQGGSPAVGGGLAPAGTSEAARELELRRLLREELSRHASASASAPEPAVPPASGSAAAASTPSPQTVVQVERAHAVLDSAIARLTWTNADASAFKNATASLPPAERMELLRKFATAVNEQGMRLETAGSPL
jgi:hypothetical protein